MRRVVQIAALALGLVVAAVAGAAAKPYELSDTQVLELRSKQTGATYQLFVSAPPDYRKSGKSYPVVYMLDADYSFALVRNVVRHLVERDGLPEMILVAIAYPGSDRDRTTYKRNRTRDYTPVYAPEGGYGTEFQKLSGGGPKFRAFLSTELFAFVERQLPVDPNDRTIIGHSYGGLFATFVLLTEPALFKRYIIVSPSLWYAKKVALTMEESAAAIGQPARAAVFFGVGALEPVPMPDDVTELYRRLRRGSRPGLQVTLKMFEGENHDTIFPVAVTRGLREVFGAR